MPLCREAGPLWRAGYKLQEEQAWCGRDSLERDWRGGPTATGAASLLLQWAEDSHAVLRSGFVPQATPTLPPQAEYESTGLVGLSLMNFKPHDMIPPTLSLTSAWRSETVRRGRQRRCAARERPDIAGCWQGMGCLFSLRMPGLD
jgi:hypothetical protein